MRYLLDTHTIIWPLDGSQNLSANAKALFLEKKNVLWVSTASLWELAIKLSIGKLKLSITLEDSISETQHQQIGILPILPSHLYELQTLPFIHRDPFDRLLIAQAKHEGLTLIGQDSVFKDYGVTQVW